jgi:hypothetical protein
MTIVHMLTVIILSAIMLRVVAPYLTATPIIKVWCVLCANKPPVPTQPPAQQSNSPTAPQPRTLRAQNVILMPSSSDSSFQPLASMKI